jgi:hypothetical protein
MRFFDWLIPHALLRNKYLLLYTTTTVTVSSISKYSKNKVEPKSSAVGPFMNACKKAINPDVHSENEASADSDQNMIYISTTAPHVHRRNAAKRVIRTC